MPDPKLDALKATYGGHHASVSHVHRDLDEAYRLGELAMIARLRTAMNAALAQIRVAAETTNPAQRARTIERANRILSEALGE